MQAVANSLKFAKKVGVPQSVGREFTKGSEMKKKVKKFGMGGMPGTPVVDKTQPLPTTTNPAVRGPMGRGPMGGPRGPMGGPRGPMGGPGRPMPSRMKKGGAVAAKETMGPRKMGKVVAGGKKPHGEHTVQKSGMTKGKMVKMRAGGMRGC